MIDNGDTHNDVGSLISPFLRQTTQDYSFLDKLIIAYLKFLGQGASLERKKEAADKEHAFKPQRTRNCLFEVIINLRRSATIES